MNAISIYFYLIIWLHDTVHIWAAIKYKLVSWKLQDTHRDEYTAFPPLDELMIKQGKDARLRAERPKGQSTEWKKKSLLIAELMEFFKEEVTSDLDSEEQVMGENTPEHRSGMTKALSPNLAHPESLGPVLNRKCPDSSSQCTDWWASLKVQAEKLFNKTPGESLGKEMRMGVYRRYSEYKRWSSSPQREWHRKWCEDRPTPWGLEITGLRG